LGVSTGLAVGGYSDNRHHPHRPSKRPVQMIERIGGNGYEYNETEHQPGPESFKGKKGMGEAAPAYLS